MPVVYIPSPLRDLTGGETQVAIEGDNVGEVIEALDRRFPGVKSRLCRDGSLAPGIQISVNDVMTTRGLRAKLEPADELHFLPVIGGG